MPWGRTLLGLLVSALVLAGGGFVVAQIAGLQPVALPSAPGLNAADSAALAQPFEQLASGADAELISRLANAPDRAQAARQIDQMQALLPVASPTSSRLVVWSTLQGTNGQQLSGVHEHTFPDHVARTETVLARANATEPWRVDGFHLNVAAKSELAQNQLTLAGKPPHYVALVVAAALNPIFILATFWAALFWRGLKPRWLWLIAVLIGAGQFSLNAATGAWAFSPISIQLLGSGASWSGSAFDAWVFTVSLPLGALAFWLTRPLAKRQPVAA